MADEDDKPKPPTYEELEAEVLLLRATVSRLSSELGKRDETIAGMKKAPRTNLVLDAASSDRFRRPLQRR